MKHASYVLHNPVILDIDLPATVDASFFRLLKLSAPSWFKIPGNISAISERVN